MNGINPYLFFDGDCREAMDAYTAAFGGKLSLTTYGEAQGESCPLADRDRVMHASLASGGSLLMGADRPDRAPQKGDHVQVAVACESREEIERLYAALAEGGKALYPLHDAPWGAVFGTLMDRFGIIWMFNYDKNTPQG